ncbi:MAG: hypothetical protein CM1200mP41_28020 [Gammaproteobacteria bacterium]|nr:MAG: hypothetical protein CM1200mP41_28020 [Gammaproteobacteria bacterium]
MFLTYQCSTGNIPYVSNSKIKRIRLRHRVILIVTTKVAQKRGASIPPELAGLPVKTRFHPAAGGFYSFSGRWKAFSVASALYRGRLVGIEVHRKITFPPVIDFNFGLIVFHFRQWGLPRNRDKTCGKGVRIRDPTTSRRKITRHIPMLSLGAVISTSAMAQEQQDSP